MRPTQLYLDTARLGRMTPQGVVTEYSLPSSPQIGDKPGSIAAGQGATLWFFELETNDIGRLILARA